ncbi:hypothetical protein PUV54_09675 [Hyphococcus flavus]|uniref:Uncharacterized protein n=1 Tax=Hyphococcus flavus TaxID=1866326 RepID=A0AAE9ZA31_9PROT|nr:hypothetical protein [Hyphococcus flavus]WDI30229.1 hypothetical protein PUV54_09675 [Hyphococcus flavus]
MLEKIGLAALVILIASETFAVSEAVLWSTVYAFHWGAAAGTAALVISIALGASAGFGIFRLSQIAKQSERP